MTSRRRSWRSGLARPLLTIALLVALPGRTVEAQAGACLAPPPAPTEVAVGSLPGAVALGDFNGDGKLDLVTANVNANSLSIRLGAGNGAFATADPADVFVGDAPGSVAVGDVNGDGKADLVVANAGSNTASIRLGIGNGTFAPAGPPELVVGANPQSVAVADFNGDGRADLAVANADSDNVSIRLGAGAGTFAAPSLAEVTVGDRPVSVVTGDFNRDGRADLAVANQDAGSVSIRLGNGDGTFASALLPEVAVGSQPVAVALGDLDGDGRLDLVAANQSTGSVSVWLGTGNGTFTAPSPARVAVGGRPVSVAVADFNRDGRADLATANLGADSVSIRVGAGNGTFAAPRPAEVAVEARPVSLAPGDFNGDGAPDLAVANLFDDSVSIRLNGCAASVRPVAGLPEPVIAAEDAASGPATTDPTHPLPRP